LSQWTAKQQQNTLNPVHTSNNVKATLSNATKSNVASTLLPKRLHCRSNGQQSCQLLWQCCFDIVACVDRALRFSKTWH